MFRIFLYKIDKKTKMCLEIIYSKNQDINREIKKALSILKNFGIIVKKYSNTFDRRELRHILFTIRDLNMIQKYEKTHIANTILPGGWHIIGRDNKINFIYEKLKFKK